MFHPTEISVKKHKNHRGIVPRFLSQNMVFVMVRLPDVRGLQMCILLRTSSLSRLLRMMVISAASMMTQQVSTMADQVIPAGA